MAQKATPFSARDFLKLGLETANYPKWESYKESTLLGRFKKHFYVTPQTCADAWEMMRNFPVGNESRLEEDARPVHLLLACRFLFTYGTEDELASFFGAKHRLRAPKSVAKWCKIYVRKLAGLLEKKMGTLEENDHGLIFLMTIDGTHCPIEEPRPFNTKWSSHKFGKKAAVNYELGVSLYEPKLIWCYGPTAPGEMTDLMVFREKLKWELPAGKRVIADGIYKAETQHISTKNDLDTKELRQFKDRAEARQENFNQRLKCFGALKQVYRHGIAESESMADTDNIPHGCTMRACCSLTMFQIENFSTHLLEPYP